jgi:two-component system nitrogen regulation response regulator NtrX
MDFERQFILKKLEENEGNISKTAEAIGLERSNLHKKLKSLKAAAKNES